MPEFHTAQLSFSGLDTTPSYCKNKGHIWVGHAAWRKWRKTRVKRGTVQTCYSSWQVKMYLPSYLKGARYKEPVSPFIRKICMVQVVRRFRTSMREVGRTAVGWYIAAWSYRTEMERFLTQSLMQRQKRSCLKTDCDSRNYHVPSYR